MDVSKLRSLGACSEAVEWAFGQADEETAWSFCKRGDWMLWLIGKTAGDPWSDSRKPLVLVACECARFALPYTKDPRVLKCIETSEAWTKGEATIEEVRNAAANAYAAAAASASSYAAATAAAAAADAAYAAAYITERKKVLKQCANIVRKHYTKAPAI